MPERFEKLKATIRELETELGSLDSLDAETQRVLEEAMAEIQTAIHGCDPQQLEPHSLNEKLATAAERFETSHPNLYGLVHRIIEGLAQMGI